MKRITAILLACVLLFGLAGCGNASAPTDVPSGGAAPTGTPDDAPDPAAEIPGSDPGPGMLMGGASPETSALELFYYDGEAVAVRTLYDAGREQAILDELNALRVYPAEAPDLSQWQLPCYGLWISDKDGRDLTVAWSNGLWLDRDGTVRRVDADFAGLWQSLEGWGEEDDWSVLTFPNAKWLAPYDIRFMEKAEPVQSSAAQEGVTFTVEQVVNGIATVTLDNQSDHEFEYSAYYSLQKELDGAWYTMPADLAFIDIAYILPSGGIDRFECDLTYYGTLEPGHYRLAKDGLYAEFTLDANSAYRPAPPAVTMTVNNATSEGAVVTLANNGEDTGYVADFVLARLEDGVWTEVPFAEDYGICGVQDPLPAGETVNINLDFTFLFGGLPAGHYWLRFVLEGWSAEFEIE